MGVILHSNIMQDSTSLIVDYVRALYMRSSLYNLKPLTTSQEIMASEITNPIFLGIIQDMNQQMQPRQKTTTKKFAVCEAPQVPEKELLTALIARHKGKVQFIDFWATWCLPCLFQLPEFEKLSEKYPDIRFIGISIDQNEKLWVKKLKKDGMPAHIQEVLADPYVVGDAWDITSIPRFLLIDENFRIINAFAPRPSDREKIEPLLAR